MSRSGEGILATHHWPTTDPYSFTVAGQPWIAYEWLGEVLLAATHRLAGISGLDALLILLGFAVLVALYALATVRSGNAKAGFAATAILIMLATPSFSLRPQMLGYLFLILTLLALERFRQGKGRALWFLPILFLLWVNAHGSFVVGMGTLAAYYIGGLWEFRAGRYRIAALASCGAPTTLSGVPAVLDRPDDHALWHPAGHLSI